VALIDAHPEEPARFEADIGEYFHGAPGMQAVECAAEHIVGEALRGDLSFRPAMNPAPRKSNFLPIIIRSPCWLCADRARNPAPLPRAFAALHVAIHG
jgi:hypothetical protein